MIPGTGARFPQTKTHFHNQNITPRRADEKEGNSPYFISNVAFKTQNTMNDVLAGAQMYPAIMAHR